MLCGHSKKDGHRFKRSRFITALVASTAALLASCIHSFAEDQTMTVLAQASSGPLQCEIQKIDKGSSVELTGVITSSVAIAGNFRFLVTKSGPSGSSNINQGNKFDLAAGAQTHVGNVTINIERDAHVVVELLATSNDGIECSAKAPLER